MAEDFYSNPQNMFASFPSHLQPEAILSVEEATDQANAKRKTLFDTWDKLHLIVNAHESTIRKRWAKKFNLTYQGTMHPKSALSIHATRTYMIRGIHFYFHMSILKIYRGIMGLSLHFGIMSGGIKRVYVPDFDNDDPNAPNGSELDFVLGEALPLADGLAVLEAQIKLLDFLLRMVSKILVDQDLEAMPKEPKQLRMDPHEIPLTDSEFVWMSSARTNSLRPYLEPFNFSYLELKSIIETSYQLALDHLIELHTDPAYLHEQILLYLEHRLETLCLPPAPQSLVYNRAIKGLLLDAYGNLTHWDSAKKSLTTLDKVLADEPSWPLPHARRLPGAYQRGFQELRATFRAMEQELMVDFPKIVASSPQMRQFFKIRFLDSNYGKNELSGFPPRNDRLMEIMSILINPQQTHLWQIARLYDELDQLMGNSNQHSRISPLLAHKLSRIGVINDAKVLIDAHRPKISEEDSKETQDRTEWRILFLNFYTQEDQNMDWAHRCEMVDEAFNAFWLKANEQLKRILGLPIYNLGNDIVKPYIGRKTNWVTLVSSKPAPKGQQAPAVVLPFGGAEQSSQIVADEVSATIPRKKKKQAVARSVSPDAMQKNIDGISISEGASNTPILVSARTLKTFSMLFQLTDNEQLVSQSGSIAWTEGSAFSKPEVPRRSLITQMERVSPVFHEPHPEASLSFWRARNFWRRLQRRFGWSSETFALTSAR
ncbi:hypothetical protein BDQ12DRAFT_671927 [Crucibulum laeve]|uniref:Uncharacterized protein n=1 Tax=Crucibulum laeve TaxID=68775 RepID=A0A5C3LGR6_9AGAR|nr:hypothetical protein BDQ12DRAFT_671927 [Crucibulum laeve]